MAGRPLIIDCDPGQDDAIALLLAFASPEAFDLLGVCALAGNVPVELTAMNARRVRELAGRLDVPIYAGCPRPILHPLRTAEHVHGKSGIDGAELPEPTMPLEQTHALDFITETLRTAKEKVTIATLGPLTDIAVALVKEPRILENIREIVMMGGMIGAGNVTPSAEFNIHTDPHAAHIVFTSGAKLTMIGLDVTHQAVATPERLAAIRALQGRPAAAVAGMIEFYGEKRVKAFNLAGAPLHDPCVIAYLLKPSLFEGRDMFVEVELASPATRGRTVCDPWNVTGRTPNVQVIESIDVDGFFALLVERLARLPA